MKRIWAGAIGGALLLATPAQAQDVTPTERADVQCFAVSAHLLGQAGPESEIAGGLTAMMMYYLGRLEGRTPQKNWLAVIGDYAETATEDDLMLHAQRCGEEMQAKGEAMSALAAERGYKPE